MPTGEDDCTSVLPPGDAAALLEALPSIQLYNLREDLGERTNVQGSNAEIITNLVKLLERYVADGRTTPGPVLTSDVRVNIWNNKNQKARD